MATAKSNYLEGKIIEHVLRNVNYTRPTTVYLALYTTDPTEANTGTQVSGGSYARQAITFGAQVNGAVSNTSSVSFTGMPSATVTHVGILDASTGGNLLYYGALTTTVTVTTGSTVSFASSAVTVTET